MPVIHPIRQTAPQPRVADIAEAIRQAWEASPLRTRIRPGMRIALACGSRGIQNYQAIVQANIQALQRLGAQPCIVAAMGSHGGATADGQRELLASYGIAEATLGVPVLTDMDALEIGLNSWGQPVWWDKNALALDGVIPIARIKPHTDFRGRYESGIVKMLVIGLGKRLGADQHHRYGTRGLRDMMLESVQVILEQAPVLGGFAILENAREETAHIELVDRDAILDREPLLLEEARHLMGRLPFEQLDVLLIGELGKNYSGSGIDPNVVGRLLIEASPEMELAAAKPRITRIGVLDVSPESHGNATGVGIADLTTTRLLRQIEQGPFRMNNLTARFLWRSKLPFAFDADQDCLEACLETCWQPDRAAIRMAIIPNTLEVADLWVTSPLLSEVERHPHLERTGDARVIPFTPDGTLCQEELFPHSIRSRRKG